MQKYTVNLGRTVTWSASVVILAEDDDDADKRGEELENHINWPNHHKFPPVWVVEAAKEIEAAWYLDDEAVEVDSVEEGDTE